MAAKGIYGLEPPPPLFDPTLPLFSPTLQLCSNFCLGTEVLRLSAEIRHYLKRARRFHACANKGCGSIEQLQLSQAYSLHFMFSDKKIEAYCKQARSYFTANKELA